jgi:hypothetical protein
MLAAEEENEAEVRREDQENINQFARLNARLGDAQNERERLKVRYCVHFTLLLWIAGWLDSNLLLVDS